MAIYDNNGTTNYEFGHIYDNNGSTNYEFNYVYDNNGSTNYTLLAGVETISGTTGAKAHSDDWGNPSFYAGWQLISQASMAVGDTIKLNSLSFSRNGIIMAWEFQINLNGTYVYHDKNAGWNGKSWSNLGPYTCTKASNMQLYIKLATDGNTTSGQSTVNVSYNYTITHA